MVITFDELKEKIYHDVYEVYEVFVNFFNEEHVDLKGTSNDDAIRRLLPAEALEHREDNVESYQVTDELIESIKNSIGKFEILVWWPEVTVSNENDKQVIIQDLYAKIELTIQGTVPLEAHGFLLNRTTFSEVQYKQGYIHSHIPTFFRMPEFSAPCLGRGPIKRTIIDLKTSNSEAAWMLFCQELSMYVTVESLTGGPYIKLESLGKSSPLYDYEGYYLGVGSIVSVCNSFRSLSYRYVEKLIDIIKGFLPYYLHNTAIKFNYANSRFCSGVTFYNFMVDISNCFIDYLNNTTDKTIIDKIFVNTLYKEKVLIKTIASDGTFYNSNELTPDIITAYEGRPMFIFKDETKCLHIDRNHEDRYQTTTILCKELAMAILKEILKTINYRFNNVHRENTGTEGGNPSSKTYKTVYYL